MLRTELGVGEWRLLALTTSAHGQAFGLVLGVRTVRGASADRAEALPPDRVRHPSLDRAPPLSHS